MVEFALMAPILMFILLGVLDFGMVYYYEIASANAAREAAAYVAHSGDTIGAGSIANEELTPLSGTTKVVYCQGYGSQPAQCPPNGDPSGNPLYVVTVSVPFTPLTPFIGQFFPNNAVSSTVIFSAS